MSNNPIVGKTIIAQNEAYIMPNKADMDSDYIGLSVDWLRCFAQIKLKPVQMSIIYCIIDNTYGVFDDNSDKTEKIKRKKIEATITFEEFRSYCNINQANLSRELKALTDGKIIKISGKDRKTIAVGLNPNFNEHVIQTDNEISLSKQITKSNVHYLNRQHALSKQITKKEKNQTASSVGKQSNAGKIKKAEKPCGSNKQINRLNQTTMKQIILEVFGNEDFIPPIMNWIAHKAEKKQAYKPIGFKALCEELKENTGNNPQIAKDLIRKAMANNWAGIVYPNSNNKSNGVTKQTYGSREVF